jgi:NAD-dependent SIR2 family protein deacetylase
MRTYLFGNGASIPYGSPIGSDIFKTALNLLFKARQEKEFRNLYYRLKDDIEFILSRLDDIRNKIASGHIDYLHWGEYSLKFTKLLNPNIDPIEYKQLYTDIESYFAGIRIWELLPEIIDCYNDTDKHGYYDLKQKRHCLLDVPQEQSVFDRIGRFSFRVIYFAIKYVKSTLNHCDNFIKIINNESEDVLIINLNYDNLLENSIEKYLTNLSVNHNFGNITHFPLENKKTFLPNLILVKPHGSFDYVYCEKCNAVSISQNINIERSVSDDNKKCKNPNCDNHVNLPNFYIPYAEISLPVRYKDITISIINELSKILDKCDEITSIGYSFSTYNNDLIDRHLKFIFKNRKVNVISRNPTEAISICNRVNPLGFNMVPANYHGFNEFVSKM